jgi:hypothetical protein
MSKQIFDEIQEKANHETVRANSALGELREWIEEH